MLSPLLNTFAILHSVTPAFNKMFRFLPTFCPIVFIFMSGLPSVCGRLREGARGLLELAERNLWVLSVRARVSTLTRHPSFHRNMQTIASVHTFFASVIIYLFIQHFKQVKISVCSWCDWIFSAMYFHHMADRGLRKMDSTEAFRGSFLKPLCKRINSPLLNTSAIVHSAVNRPCVFDNKASSKR